MEFNCIVNEACQAWICTDYLFVGYHHGWFESAHGKRKCDVAVILKLQWALSHQRYATWG